MAGGRRRLGFPQALPVFGGVNPHSPYSGRASDTSRAQRRRRWHRDFATRAGTMGCEGISRCASRSRTGRWVRLSRSNFHGTGNHVPRQRCRWFCNPTTLPDPRRATAAGLEPREDVSSPAAPCNTDTRSMDGVGGGLPRHHAINVVHCVYSAHGVQDTVEVGHVPHFENEA